MTHKRRYNNRFQVKKSFIDRKISEIKKNNKRNDILIMNYKYIKIFIVVKSINKLPQSENHHSHCEYSTLK